MKQGAEMTLESIYYVGQTIAVVALVISIVFVGLQIRLNTKATRAASVYDINEMWAEVNLVTARDPVFSSLVSRHFEENARLEDFTPGEAAQVELLVMSILQRCQAGFFLSLGGSLEKSHWQNNGDFAREYIQHPMVAKIYQNQVTTNNYLPEFVEELQKPSTNHPSSFFVHNQTEEAT
jgi:hypothetical protein